jgi:hypothetical protein
MKPHPQVLPGLQVETLTRYGLDNGIPQCLTRHYELNIADLVDVGQYRDTPEYAMKLPLDCDRGTHNIRLQ